MGLPEGYRLPGSATGALHVLGDGVAVPVVRWLSANLLEPLLAEPATAIAAE
jgi:DNA (cytosine-5)-methyltransferase 1